MMTVYLTVSLLALLASLPLASAFICLSPASAVPLALIGLSIFQAILLRSMENEQSDLHGLNYSRAEKDPAIERHGMMWHTRTKLAIVPPMCVFILYFGTPWKVTVPVVLYCLSFVVAGILTRHPRKE